MLYTTPNKFARRAFLEERDDVLTFHGYQEFCLGKNTLNVLAVDENLCKKRGLLANFFETRYFEDRTIVDFGANSGFFCFWALNHGASKAIALDMDEEYLEMLRRGKAKFGYDKLDVVKSNLEDWEEPCDVVLALALVHWIYSCTATFGDLDAIVEKFAKLAKYMLIVEWVEPDDPAINFFHHLDWNKQVKRGPYTLNAFEEALSKNFTRYECLGSITPTRTIFAAYHCDSIIDLSGPLPILFDKATIVSRRMLARHEGKEYWSCVYDGGDVIYKQATKELAENGARFTSQLNNDYFPRLLAKTSAA
ncbi:MAG: class I SAM-dependent methyltransferase, partial [Thermoguttaceae bacterium]